MDLQKLNEFFDYVQYPGDKERHKLYINMRRDIYWGILKQNWNFIRETERLKLLKLLIKYQEHI